MLGPGRGTESDFACNNYYWALSSETLEKFEEEKERGFCEGAVVGRQNQGSTESGRRVKRESGLALIHLSL